MVSSVASFAGLNELRSAGSRAIVESCLDVGFSPVTAARDSLVSPPNSDTNSASGLYNLRSPIKGQSVPGAEVGGVFGWSCASHPVVAALASLFKLNLPRHDQPATSPVQRPPALPLSLPARAERHSLSGGCPAGIAHCSLAQPGNTLFCWSSRHPDPGCPKR